jgi:hypothetical protein
MSINMLCGQNKLIYETGLEELATLRLISPIDRPIFAPGGASFRIQYDSGLLSREGPSRHTRSREKSPLGTRLTRSRLPSAAKTAILVDLITVGYRVLSVAASDPCLLTSPITISPGCHNSSQKQSPEHKANNWQIKPNSRRSFTHLDGRSNYPQ